MRKFKRKEKKRKEKKKREAKRKMDRNRDDESREEFKMANKLAKRVVAKAKSDAYQCMYDDMESKESQNSIFRIAKQRDEASKDIKHVKMIKDENGSVLYEETEVLNRWKSYFETLMNEENPRVERDHITEKNHCQVAEVSVEEIRKALAKMKHSKAVGPDNIPIEVWKYLGDYGLNFLKQLFDSIMVTERMPEEWRTSTLVPIYKNKGDGQSCTNYRGIKLLCHTMKLWERIVNTRIRSDVEISNEQFGFMPKRSTIDAIFALRMLQEKYGEGQKELHCSFIDLEKAFDRVPRDEVWYCLRAKKVPEKYVRCIQDMYKNSKTKVRCAVGTTESFEVKVGVHQGSALSPLLFVVVMDVITEQVRREVPWNMMFADDVVLIQEQKELLETEIENWRDALETRGLKVSRSKTEYVCFNKKSEQEPPKLQDNVLKESEEFKYVGSTIHKDGSSKPEVNKRIQAGWSGWKKVTGVLCDKRVPAQVKGRIFKTMVRPAMLYGVETVPLTKSMECKMEVAEMKMLRWSVGVTRRDEIRNETIRGSVKVSSIRGKVQERRLEWFGHVERRNDNYIGKRVMNMGVPGPRRRGRPRTRWMDNIRKDMVDRRLEKEDCQDRVKWRRAIRCGDPS